MSHTNNNSVLFNVDQSYPETSTGGASKERARRNINAASATALTSEVSRASAAEAAAKTEVTAGTGINVSSTTAPDGHRVYTVTNSQIASQVNSDWNSTQGVSQILNKPDLLYKPYGGVARDISNLTLDGDDPEGYVDLQVNTNGSIGQLVAGPHKRLLDSGVNGVGDSTHPVYIDGNGEFQQASASGSEIITRSAPYNVSVPVTQLTIYDPGERFGSLLSDQLSNNIGFLLPRHYGNQDLGKVPTVVEDNGYKIKWMTPSAGAGLPIRKMTSVTVDVDTYDDPAIIDIETGKCFYCKVSAGNEIQLSCSNSSEDQYSIVYVYNDPDFASCPSFTVWWWDESGDSVENRYLFEDYQADTWYGYFVQARLVEVSPGYFKPLCRVFPYPCSYIRTPGTNDACQNVYYGNT